MDAASEPRTRSPPPAPSAGDPSRTDAPPTEVSPGEGAFAPPASNAAMKRAPDDGDADAVDAGSNCDDAFGPPPAFPSAPKNLGKRKRTLMAVSASAGGASSGAPLDGLSSEDEDEEEGSGAGGKKKHSQLIHRIKAESGTPPREDGVKYGDAMLLASLSDVDSPKKPDDAPRATAAAGRSDTRQEAASSRRREGVSPARSSNASTASTPQRSNVNPHPPPAAKGGGAVVRPFPLQPKSQAPSPRRPANEHKRPKYSEGNTLAVVAPAPQSPDGRDPKAVKGKKEGAREGYAPTQQPRLDHRQGAPGMPAPGGAYPTPGYPGYPYPPAGPTSYAPASGHPAYSHGYPYHGSYPPHPHAAPPSVVHPSPYHPRAYYPPGGHSQVPPPGQAPPGYSGPPGGGSAAERWGQYHSPKHSTSGGPEPVRSNGGQPYHLPSSRSSSPGRSHVVPTEDSEGTGGYRRPAPPVPPPYGSGPPSQGAGYPGDPRYGGPPPPARDGYYAPPGGEYPTPTISRDDGSPPRSSQSVHPEYSSSVATPPRGHYPDYYHDQPPSSGYGPPSHAGYPPETSPGSAYPGSSYYSRGPPAHDPYEPFDYAAPSPNEAHYHVPATVSNETESPRHAGPPPGTSSAPPPPMGGSRAGYHQFRKGGRTIHSEPVILRKKFSWRNYPELEEYLIANRTDYLRHSALNYTAEQKHFNNRLTEGLLELAAKLNYVFDETCFNFVAVRDRIRCYYKSYVQSSKKRGVVVGFAKQQGAKTEGAHDHRDGVVGHA